MFIQEMVYNCVCVCVYAWLPTFCKLYNWTNSKPWKTTVKIHELKKYSNNSKIHLVCCIWWALSVCRRDVHFPLQLFSHCSLLDNAYTKISFKYTWPVTTVLFSWASRSHRGACDSSSYVNECLWPDVIDRLIWSSKYTCSRYAVDFLFCCVCETG